MTTPVTPKRIVEPFAADQIAPYITATIPLVPGAPGVANFSEGFPAATMIDPTSGGVPPDGADFNGIFYAITSWLAFFQSGQRIAYDATASAAFAPGYPLGAVLYNPTDKCLYQSTAAANITDPGASVLTWRNLQRPLYAASTPSAGAHNNVVLGGPSDYVLDLDTTAGNASYSGFVAQFDGQKLIISNTGANLLTLVALATSSAANQFRLPTDLALVQNQTVVLQYSTGAGKWLLV